MFAALLARYPALAFPRFRRYWFASFASVGATQLITLGQGWLVFELSGSPLQLGWLGAAAAIPNIFMTLIGGVIADRFNQRLIIMFTSATIAALLGLQAWLAATDQAPWSPWTVVSGCTSTAPRLVASSSALAASGTWIATSRTPDGARCRRRSAPLAAPPDEPPDSISSRFAGSTSQLGSAAATRKKNAASGRKSRSDDPGDRTASNRHAYAPAPSPT